MKSIDYFYGFPCVDWGSKIYHEQNSTGTQYVSRGFWPKNLKVIVQMVDIIGKLNYTKKAYMVPFL